ncbi:hypothetical protein A2G58_02730 [Streptococcus pneumoniae]|nr:hypothetical protein A2G58_02730 [Streptococcus pneumoniae]
MGRDGMSYTMNLYPDIEKIPVVCKTLDTIIENQKAILQGVASGQITFLNKSKGEEELDESIRE